MNREEITNSQDYKATKIALDWWYSLPEEQRKATDIDAEPDIVDAYSDGVIYGWNNPNWISVEDQLPEECELVYAIREGNVEPGIYKFMAKDQWEWAPRFIACLDDITHWMPLPQPPRKEDKK